MDQAKEADKHPLVDGSKVLFTAMYEWRIV
jgi:hypothetical protein